MKRFRIYLLFCVLASLGATFGLAYSLIKLKETESIHEVNLLEAMASFKGLTKAAAEYQNEFKEKIESKYLEGSKPENILETTSIRLLRAHHELGDSLENSSNKMNPLFEELKKWNSSSKNRFLKFHEQVSMLVAEVQPRFERLQSTVQFFKVWKSELEQGLNVIQNTKQKILNERKSNLLSIQKFSLLILFSVLMMAMGFLWFSEKMLKPVRVLTELIRSLRDRGLHPEDREALLMLPRLKKNDVSELAREFYDMTTSLLEREKTVEYQKIRLSEQNVLLKSLGEMNAKILDQMKSGFLIFDQDRKIKRLNEMVSRLEHKKEDDLIGKDYRNFSFISKMIENATDGETKQFGKFGPLYFGEFCFSGYIQLLEFPHDYMLMFFDVTEQMYLQDRLRNAEKLAAIGRMSAQVAHEIRNPLHAIGLEAEIAQDAVVKVESEVNRKLSFEVMKNSLIAILQSVRRLEKITSNYLRLSKLSAGIKENVIITNLLQEIIHGFEATCKEKLIVLHMEKTFESEPIVCIDQMLFVQAMGNLIQNAIQALEGISTEINEEINSQRYRKEILVRLSMLENGRLLILVRDNGPGVSPAVRAKLFQPFVTSKAEGTGLGLSFVKQTFMENGGDIHLNVNPTMDLNSKHTGAQFEITLPLVIERKSKTWPPAFSKENSSLL